MRTIAYVDGFNLYHGCLKRAAHCRWLDVQALATRLCREQNPDQTLVGVGYFSAPVKAALSPHGLDSCIAQQDYWLALRAHCPLLEIVLGDFFVASGSYHVDAPGPVDFTRKVRVLRPEEKRTDVNIALRMVLDAIDGRCEQQVLFSNDSDCVPALETIRTRCPDMRLGVIAPIPRGERSGRRPSADLLACAHWARDAIGENELLACQLPEPVRTRKRSIHRPERWRQPPA